MMERRSMQDIGDDGLYRRAEKAVSLSADGLHVTNPGDAVALLGELLRRAESLETRVEQVKETARRVEELRRQCTDLYDFAPVGYFLVDHAWVIADANFTACDMLRCSKDSLIGKLFVALAEPRYYDGLRSYLREITETGHRLGCEIEMAKGDGTTFYAQLETVSLYVESAITFRISAADVTPRKRAEAALEVSERRFRELADLFPEPIFETDNKGRATYANRKSLLAFGLTEIDLSRGISIFDYVAPDERRMAAERFARVLEEGDIGPTEYTLLAGDGSRLLCRVHTAAITMEGRAVGVRGVAVDISDIRRMEQALREGSATGGNPEPHAPGARREGPAGPKRGNT